MNTFLKIVQIIQNDCFYIIPLDDCFWTYLCQMQSKYPARTCIKESWNTKFRKIKQLASCTEYFIKFT